MDEFLIFIIVAVSGSILCFFIGILKNFISHRKDTLDILESADDANTAKSDIVYDKPVSILEVDDKVSNTRLVRVHLIEGVHSVDYNLIEEIYSATDPLIEGALKTENHKINSIRGESILVKSGYKFKDKQIGNYNKYFTDERSVA